MGEYIGIGTKLPGFYQFPEFLLRAPLSGTAKLAYMLLYDRARLSEKNGWVNDGRVYVRFPLREIARSLGKSLSTAQKAVSELEAAGMLISEGAGGATANTLYVLLPDDKQFLNSVRKSVRGEVKNRRGGYRNPAPGGTGSLPPNKVINHNNNHRKETEACPCYGRYKNIPLTDEEHRRLLNDLPYSTERIIEEMSVWCEASGKTYANYEAAIRSWAAKAGKSGKRSVTEDYSCMEGESF